MQQFIKLLEESLNRYKTDACHLINQEKCIYFASQISGDCDSCIFNIENKNKLKAKIAVLKTIEMLSN